MRLACPYQLSPTQNLLGNGMMASARNTGAATDPYWANVVLLAINDNAADGTTTFIDQSTAAHILTANGNAQYDTAQAPTGATSSALLDGTGDYISTPDATDFALGTSNFAVELFFRTNTVTGNRTYIGQGILATSSGAFQITASGTALGLFLSANGTTWGITSALSLGTIAIDTWYHAAASRTGTTIETYLNGSRGGTATSSASVFNSTANLVVGANSGAAQAVNGWIGCARVTIGSNRGYTGATITVPDLPMPTS